MANSRHHANSGAVRPRTSAALAGAAAVSFVGLAVLLLHALLGERPPAGSGSPVLLFAAALVLVLAVGPVLWRVVSLQRRLSGGDLLPDPGAATEERGGARRHRRFVPRHRATTLMTLDGRTVAARIVDLSLGGVAVEARISDLELATVTRVGSRRASPIRRTAAGAVFGFETLLDPIVVDENLVL